MDAAQFLARVVPPGNYLALAYKGQTKGMSQRFFPRDRVGQAAEYARWLADQKSDVWFAVASYDKAAPDKKKFYRGERTAENAQMLRAFWMDLDVKRPGDNKKAGGAYADITSATTWLRSFCAAIKLPQPNLVVHSGYGLHVYWVLEDPVDRPTWHPYAVALKAAMVANGGIGDIGLVADAARILRLPDTFNFKVPTDPKPVRVLGQSSEYPNQEIYDALEPYRSVSMVNGHAGANALAGSPPTVMARTGSLTAAQAGLDTREKFFAAIATQCAQVARSLKVNGDGDGYDLWYKGHLTLAHFCNDGESYAHEISQGDPRYSAAGVDSSRQQIAGEVAKKNLGAPTCVAYDGYRTGICPSCPHYGKLTSPIALATPVVAGDPDELPAGYRRNNGRIERRVMKGEEEHWLTLIQGDVRAPVLDQVGLAAHSLIFTYEFGGRSHYVVINRSLMPSDGRVGATLAGMGVELYGEDVSQFMRFCVAWINKLRAECMTRSSAVPPFGWARDRDGNIVGFSVGAILYNHDGTTAPAPGGDAQISEWYRPRGELQAWKDAAAFVLKDRPDLQVLAAAAFGAPLMEFTGETGVTFSAWSRDSGVGKSSAVKIGQTVWGTFAGMCSMQDTHNAARKIIATIKVLPAYWDEMRHNDARAEELLNLMFELAQGKDKARLNSDTSLRKVEEWKTIMVATSNQRFQDYIETRQHTDAEALRVFEFCIERPEMEFRVEAASMVSSSERNAGQAGSVYAAMLAKLGSGPVLKTTLEKTMEQVKTLTGADRRERLYVIGISCLLVGATLARGLGLVDFDVPAMRTYLVDQFAKLRAARDTNLTVNNGATDVDKVLGNFLADHAGERMVTSEFKGRGPTPADYKVRESPLTNRRLAYQIGQREQLLRIDWTVWTRWCRDNGLSPTDVSDQMIKRWGGSKGTRGILGASTLYATARVELLEIPLTSPELAGYIYDCARTIAGVKTQQQGGKS